MRFDQTSENSFLNEIFAYVKATEKTVGIYLGGNHTITIGDMTAKYVETGFSEIQWIEMPEDEGFGLMPRLSYIGMEARNSDEEEETPEEIPAVLTLSASYIGLPESVIETFMKKSMPKGVTCVTNNKTYYVECSGTSKKVMDEVLVRTMFFNFGGKNINIPISDLLHVGLKGKKLILNIKKTFNNRAVLGEPVFKQHYIVLDYSKNRFGFANKRSDFSSFFMDIVSLVRFLCFVFVLGTKLFIQVARSLFVSNLAERCLRLFLEDSKEEAEVKAEG